MDSLTAAFFGIAHAVKRSVLSFPFVRFPFVILELVSLLSISVLSISILSNSFLSRTRLCNVRCDKQVCVCFLPYTISGAWFNRVQVVLLC